VSAPGARVVVPAQDRRPAAAWAAPLASEFPSLRGLRVAVIGYDLLDPTSGKLATGGTETYAHTLGDMAYALGGDELYFQRHKVPFSSEVRPGLSIRSWARQPELRRLLAAAREEARGRPTVVFLFVEDLVPRPEDHPSIFLHHGILHDGTFEPRQRSRLMWLVRDARKRYVWGKRRRRLLALLTRTTRTVAVDTNVGNIARFLYPQLEWGDRIEYVPNFGEVLPRAEVVEKWRAVERPTVLFARRFVMKRGTYLWAEVLRTLAPRYPGVEFRCVGHGRGEPTLREVAARSPNVRILERPHAEMVEEHRRAHVSVVPSVWSEGTSLSAIEAMCAGSAVVSTDIGGLGNLVVPEATGLMVAATARGVEAAVARLLDDLPLARRLGLNAYRTASSSFSRIAWARRICGVLARAIEAPEPGPLARRVAPFPGAD